MIGKTEPAAVAVLVEEAALESRKEKFKERSRE